MRRAITALFVLMLGLVGAVAVRTAPALRPAFAAEYQRPAAIPFPPENPYSAAKSALGRLLFFDPVLSGSRALSCAGCHNPGLSWGDGLPRAHGSGQPVMGLRSPTLLDVAWVPRLGWDGKFRDLESVAFAPITSSANMNLSEHELNARLAAIPGYAQGFAAAFGQGEITRQKVELALATFERSIVSAPAPFDAWIAGNEDAIGSAAKRGFELFNGKARCAGCHKGWAFTDGSFQDIGAARENDLGRGRLFPTSVKLQHAFKTPTLRDVARRAPYLHDGSVATLSEIIDLYDKGGIDRASRSPLIRPLGLTNDEKQDLLAFLDTLSSPPQDYPVPALPR